VQGKGWTEARSITDDDVIAGQHGDALVLRNDAVALPLQVYNFSVAGTESYFVGTGGVWAHNARCSINPLRKATAEDAAKLGYHRLIKDPPFDPHGQKVFGNGKNYISPDADGHNGGVWKLFDKKGGRIGTYDGDLTLIKD
jgi:hypothetical protein